MTGTHTELPRVLIYRELFEPHGGQSDIDAAGKEVSVTANRAGRSTPLDIPLECLSHYHAKKRLWLVALLFLISGLAALLGTYD